MSEIIVPASFEGAALALAVAAGQDRSVRVAGGGTKLGWGAATGPPDIVLRTERLDATLEHNAGDLTAIFAAGVPFDRAQAELEAAGQRLSLDPPPAPQGGTATVGGVFATADSGPLRHRYGAPRDLILGITVALSDGTVARAGGKVIKNVAGYDLAKLFTGAFGTLGVILSVAVRLHQRPPAAATALGHTSDPAVLARVALALAGAPLELEALDVAWRDGRGALLAQAAGTTALRRCEEIAATMREQGLVEVDALADDRALWAGQRAGQRSALRAIVRISARPSQLEAVTRAAQEAGASLVGRAALGTSYLEVDPAAIGTIRVALPPGAVGVVLDLPQAARGHVEPWGEAGGATLELMRSVKRRFDPAGICNPGVFVGGI
jgi:glycolate oxidase FAD binding subunit